MICYRAAILGVLLLSGCVDSDIVRQRKREAVFSAGYEGKTVAKVIGVTDSQYVTNMAIEFTDGTVMQIISRKRHVEVVKHDKLTAEQPPTPSASP